MNERAPFHPCLSVEQLMALPSLSLAHVGDSVFELMARTAVITDKAGKNGQLHRRTVRLVRAEAQAKAAHTLLPLLTEEERDVFLRGRNAKAHSSPKHASPRDYALATGLEALFGWLYLAGRRERVAALFSTILSDLAGEEAFHEKK